MAIWWLSNIVINLPEWGGDQSHKIGSIKSQVDKRNNQFVLSFEILNTFPVCMYPMLFQQIWYSQFMYFLAQFHPILDLKNTPSRQGEGDDVVDQMLTLDDIWWSGD